MSLSGQLGEALSKCFTGHSTKDVKAFLPFQDLTLLKRDAGIDELNQLLTLAERHAPAAICVYPEQLPKFIALAQVKKATVVNFPEGHQSLEQVIDDINLAMENKADEIDYVFPYALYFQNPDKALEQSQKVLSYCHQYGLLTKIIIETSAFDSLELLYQLSSTLIEQGWDFLKTSTGKTHEGATAAKAFALIAAIADSSKDCGIKLSGGIRTCEQAEIYLNMAEVMLKKSADASWFRLGTSKLLTKV